MQRPRFVSLGSALALLVLLGNSAQAETDPLKGLDDYINKALKDWQVPGLALAIVKDDKIMVAKGYGVRKLGETRPVDEHTLFAIGSATKAFTAAALGMLVDEGKIKWDDPVIKYLPSFQLYDPYVTREMTIRDLLCHRSGLERNELVWYGSKTSREDVLHRLRYVKPGSSFRSKFGYQNIMYLAAGQIIPAVTKTSWDELVQEKIFKPLGMTASLTSVVPLRAAPDAATPHQKIDDKVQVIPWRNIDNIGPAGSINSSVHDMAQWLRLQLGEGVFEKKRLLSSGVIRQMHAPQTIIPLEGTNARLNPYAHFLCYGLGWFLQDYRAHKLIQHGGNIDGMSAMVALVPEEKLGLVILTNLNATQLPQALVYRIVDAYLQVAPRDWSAERLASVKALEAIRKNAEKKLEEERVKGTKPSLPTEKYAGTYKDDVFGELRIQWEKDKLVVRLGPIAADLEHWHYDTFRATARDRTQGKMLLTFTLDAKGKIDQVRTRSDDGVEMVLKRAADASQSAPAIVMKEEELRRFAGRYELKTPPVEISLEMLDGKLKASLPGQPVATLVPIKPTRFRVDGAAPDVFVQFDVSDGKVKGLTLEQGSGTTLKLLPKN
jgi:CubicO group peptidase (beta-lactamase class C family)